MKRVLFDESISSLAEVVIRHWGAKALEENYVLRDASGRLTFVVVNGDYTDEARASLAEKITESLGRYAEPFGFTVATPGELLEEDFGQDGTVLNAEYIFDGRKGKVRLIDRRVVGGDWIRGSIELSGPLPILFFVSLKGGVGRSTALCVLAAHLAADGKRVLAIDLDLEAPGLGSM